MRRRAVRAARPGWVALGFDIGASFGWAVLDGESGERVDSGVWDLSGGGRHEGGGIRLLRLRQRLEALVGDLRGRDVEVRVAVYEIVRRRPKVSGAEAGHVHGELRGQLKATLETLRVPHTPGEVSQAKRAATGKGNASKDMMKDAARERWGHPEGADKNGDEADALWFAELARPHGAKAGRPRTPAAG